MTKFVIIFGLLIVCCLGAVFFMPLRAPASQQEAKDAPIPANTPLDWAGIESQSSVADKPEIKDLLRKIVADESSDREIRGDAVKYILSELSSDEDSAGITSDEAKAYAHHTLWNMANDSTGNLNGRADALACLWRAGESSATTAALKIIESSKKNPDGTLVRAFATKCIAAFGGRTSGKATPSAAVSVQVAALYLLHAHSTEADRTIFEKATKASAGSVRRAGILGLEFLDAKQAGLMSGQTPTVDQIRAALSSNKEPMRDWAAAALSKHGRDAFAAIPALTKALHDHSGQGAVWKIINYLDVLRAHGITGADARPVLLQMLAEDSKFYRGRPEPETHALRSYVLLTLAEVGISKEALPHILDYLNNGEPDMEVSYATAARAAAALGADAYEAIPLLERVLDPKYADKPVYLGYFDADASIHSNSTSPRIEAIRALERMGARAEKALPLLKYWSNQAPQSASQLNYRQAALRAVASIER